ncbi:ammonia-forming cytochrome c nitrite reductase subunit c552 [Fundidesulfovibrio terrae]|uniref:ammonia-forming cytochrome c nitrite reductase subunit c552 n=1 Tax=Fundidesulfovibrio terrae TaxID=2922866 RepID=UPI001FAED160|nr:ammonia-forming cytochrome c nitrite reductase subunit c552 [Fundidesulfovibrio terrae]
MLRKRKYVLAGALALAAVITAGTATLWAVEKKNPPAAKPAAPMAGLQKPSAPVDFLEGASFVGSAACKDCHVKEFTQWAASGHANMLRPVKPEIVKADFGGVEIAYEGVEVEDADKNKVKINPKVKAETRDGKFFVTLLDADNPGNAQSYEVVEVLGSLWEQQYYLTVGDKVFPSPVRWVENDRQWRKAAFAPFWWAADGTPDGRPKKPEEMPTKQTVDYQCNGCHTTAFNAKKDDQGKYSFTRLEGGIGCEACHGPGSRHAAAPGKDTIANPGKLGTWQQEQLCGQCHIRVTSKQDKDFAFPLGFKTGQTDLQDRVEFWTYSTKPPFFWPNEDDRKNRQQYHDTMRSGHMAAGVTCSSCHLDHATQHLKSSLKLPREQQCIGCHTAQKAMFEGSVHARNGVVCVDCHMARMGNRAGATQKTPKDPWDVSAHTMRVVTPAEAEVFKMRSSCDKCHKDADRAAYGQKMSQGRDAVMARTSEVRDALETGKAPEPARLKARDSFGAVVADGSVGAHNPGRAMELLAQAARNLGRK